MKTPPGYQVLEQLGDGGQGEVFKARQIHLDRLVALKTTRPEGSSRTLSHGLERLLREAKTIARFDHPNIVRVFDCFIHEDRIFIVMEYLDGYTLAHVLEEREPEKLGAFHAAMLSAPGVLKTEWTLLLATMLSRALHYAHDQHVYHRDIKPSNIFITRTGDIKLFDFSIARDEKFKGLTATGVVIGSPPYMCPEQVKGDTSDGRSDIYSLGCVLYHCVTGHVPFEEPSEIMVCISHMEKAPRNPAQLRADVPPALAGLVLRCLEKEKEKRFQDGLEMEDALLAEFGGLIEDFSATVYPRTSSSRVSRPSVERLAAGDSAIRPVREAATGNLVPTKRRALPVAIAAVAVFAALAGIAMYAAKSTPPSGPGSESVESKTGPDAAGAPSQEELARQMEEQLLARRVATASGAFESWVGKAAQDKSLLLNKLSIEGVQWKTGKPAVPALRVTNMNPFPVELSLLLKKGSLEFEGLDSADTWTVRRGKLVLDGSSVGAAGGGTPLLLEPNKTLDIPLLAAEGSGLPGILYRHNLEIGDLRLAGSASAENAAAASEPGPSGIAVTLPDPLKASSMVPFQEKQVELPKSLLKAIILRDELNAVFDVPVPANDAVAGKLFCLSRQDSAGNLLRFLQLADEAARENRLLDQSQIQVRDLQVDSLTGSIDLFLEVDAPGHEVEVTAFIARGNQQLALKSGDQRLEIDRPLRGVLTETKTLRFGGFRDRKRLTLVELFRKDANPGALLFDGSTELRIDRLLVLCAYAKGDEPGTAKNQKLDYKTFSGIRASR